MAEGDTIVRLARRLAPVLAGREILAADAPSPRSTLRRRTGGLDGRRVDRIETRAKHLLFHLDGGLTLHSHLGMNGSWRVDRGSGFARPERSAWLVLELAGNESGAAPAGTADGAREPAARPIRVAQFGGTTLRLVRTAELERDPRLARLGPDILAPAPDLEALAGRLRASPDQTGTALLDQSVISGIGNIFKSEGCFEARIDPWRPASSLKPSAEADADEAVRLLAAVRRQMAEAVETGRRPDMVYRRRGRPCRRCRAATILSRAQGDEGRTTYWCPVCQD